MTFAQTQLRQLKRQLNRRSIKHRESNGQTLSYIEGWYAIAEANRIFGFDGWDRETVTSQCVWAKPLGIKYGAAYLTRVRITVRAGDRRVVREGLGTGEATAASPGLAHEFAAKAAETDATKRALSTFGNRFVPIALWGKPGCWSISQLAPIFQWRVVKPLYVLKHGSGDIFSTGSDPTGQSEFFQRIVSRVVRRDIGC